MELVVNKVPANMHHTCVNEMDIVIITCNVPILHDHGKFPMVHYYYFSLFSCGGGVVVLADGEINKVDTTGFLQLGIYIYIVRGPTKSGFIWFYCI